MTNRAAFLTKALISIHIFWILVMFLNLPLVIFIDEYKYFALGFITITVLSWIIWFKCPFTLWQSKLMNEKDAKRLMQTDFITFHLEKTFKIKISTYTSQAIIYAYMISIVLIAIFS